MTKRIYLLLLTFFLQFSVCHAQQQNFVRYGVVTLTDTQMFGFSNMTIANNEASFVNIANNTRVSYKLTDISLIEDDNQKVIYKGEAPKPKSAPVTDNQKVIYTSEAPKSKSLPATDTINDTLNNYGYPDGIYKTKEDFLNKKPSSTPTLRPKGLKGIEKPLLTTIEDECYFYDMQDNKLKKVFAVSYKGHLYFRIGAILDNKNKNDRAQDSHFSNGFVRVRTGGENYLYTEADLVNPWAQGLAYGVGGAAGGIAASSMIKGKGIVWDFKNKEFNIFKNCKDYNKFIEPIYPEGIQECDGQQPDMYEVREVMEKIK
jgi:hypothetical protein